MLLYIINLLVFFILKIISKYCYNHGAGCEFIGKRRHNQLRMQPGADPTSEKNSNLGGFYAV